MSGPSTYEPKTGFEKWLDTRLPIIRFANDTAIDFPTPKNLNYWWTFGGILAICLVIQIVTGIVLAMHYVPDTSKAFASVERIMRDVEFGWLVRYIHANGASMFFLAVYIHMFRGLYYGSYKAPREVLWILGVVIYLIMMGTAFLGYVLPWGQMSYHGASVITSLIGAIPLVGDTVKTFLQGGPAIGDPTLNRFFSLHYLLPFVIFGIVVLHVWALHVPGNNNPTGVSVKDVKKDTVPFHPYYTVKDGFAILVFLMIFAYFVFYAPNALGHTDNYIEANPLQTPAHIVPEWYLLPFYAILRAITFDIGPIDAKLAGVIAMFGAIAILFVVPWLDTSKVRSMRYRPLAKQFFILFVLCGIGLGFAGANNPDDLLFKFREDQLVVAYTDEAGEAVKSKGFDDYHDAEHFMQELPEAAKPGLEISKAGFKWLWAAQLMGLYYFAYFLVILPILGVKEKPKPRPASIADSVLGHKKASSGGTPIPGGANASPARDDA
ncbi:cytochrome b [Hirschia baltica]|uniref:Cytochrome b n=1 Tax=Hirschia baltica (strain ATCC 49814 / DSM 5838 / IFAM 1418) TaxID=582402 RepID=C6XPF4_HIRBI|nr:cytochrome b N-terminal domain-containing protein [Hirschia baltica]ACT58440.1 Cytochrome b/b6 domain protein [Hirschia baltica ATCC 49814]